MKKETNHESATGGGQNEREMCPKCGSADIAGLIGAFWVELDDSSEPVGQWRDWEGSTELTNERECSRCQHQWEA